jgi:hypothetical protein
VIGRALENAALPNGIRDAIVLSPLSALEVMSQLTIAKADEVLQEIHSMRNWLRPLDADILPWPDDVLAKTGFGKILKTIDVAKTIGATLIECLSVTSITSELKFKVIKLKKLLDKVKRGNAHSFDRLLKSARNDPQIDRWFSEKFFRETAIGVGADPNLSTVAEFVTSFSAYHDFERVKLQVALNSKNYNTMKHQNDLFDAEQLIYLGFPQLYFLTCDKGFRRVDRSAQAPRIIVVSHEDLSDAEKVEALLRDIIGSPRLANI